MADVFTLVLEVQGQEKLTELSGSIKGLGTAGATSEQQLKALANQTRAIREGFRNLAGQFKESFNQLSGQLNTLTAEMNALQGATTKRASGKGVIEQQAEQAEDATKSVKQLRAEIQAMYEQSLVMQRNADGSAQPGRGRTPFDATDLRVLKGFGIQLSPEDQMELKRLTDQLAAEAVQAKITKARLDELAASYRGLASAQRALSQRPTWVNEVGANSGSIYGQSVLDDLAKDYRKWERESEQLEQAYLKKQQDRLAERARQQRQLTQTFQNAANLKQWLNPEVNGKAFDQSALNSLGEEFRKQEQAALRAAAEAERAAASVSRAYQTFFQNSQRSAEWLRTRVDGNVFNSQDELAKMRDHYRSLEREAAEHDQRMAARARVANQQYRTLFQDRQQMMTWLRPRIDGNEYNSSDELARLREQYSRQEQETERAARSVRNLTRGTREHVDSVNFAAAAYGSLHTSLRGAAGAMGAVWLTWGKPLAALWAGFTVATGLKSAITQFTEFQNTLITIGAIAGETNESLKEIGATALEMSRSSIRGPQELADTLRVLTQAGLSAKDAIKVLPTVTDFATVGEMKPDAAAQSLVGISSAFGFTPSMMYKVADVVAKAAAISQTSIENMTSAMRVSSVVAEQFGAKIEDVSAILAVLAKRNIDASAAGTALRNAYTEIYTPSDKAKEVMQRIGLSAYNTNGSVKTFIETMQELAVVAQKYDKQSQNQLFSVFFGERGGKVASALLSDLDGLKAAMREMGLSAGFVDEAAIRMEDSLKNRATVAVNNLKASLIEAGAAAEGPLRQLAESLGKAFADPQFIEALKVLTNTLAAFVKLLVENAETIGKVFAVYLGYRAISGVAGLGRAAIEAAGGTKLLSGAAKDGTYSVEQLVNKAALASTTLGGVVSNMATAGSVLAVAGSGVLRALPVIGLAVGAVELAAMAWDKYRESQARALKDMPVAAKSMGETADEVLRRTNERADSLESEFETRRLGRGKRAPDSLNAAQKALVEAQKDFDTRKAEMDREPGEALPGTRKFALAASLAPFEARVAAAQRRLDAQVAAQRRLEEAETRLKRQVESEQQLGVGTLKGQFDAMTGRSYPSAVGTEISSELAEEKARFDAKKRGFDREQQLLEASRRANLMTDQYYTERVEELSQRRADTLVAEATFDALALDAKEALRRKDIDERVKDPAEKVKQYRALAAEFKKLRTEAAIRIDEAQQNADQIERTTNIAVEGRLTKMVDDWRRNNDEVQTAINEQGRKDRVDLRELVTSTSGAEELARFKQKLTGMSDAEIDFQERQLQIRKAFAKRIADLEKDKMSPASSLTEARDAEREALRIAKESFELQQQQRSDPMAGIRASARRMLSDVENVAEQSGKVFENAFSNAEEAFVQFAKTGKFSMRDLVSSIIGDMARLGARGLSNGLLRLVLDNIGGGGYSAAGGGGVAANAAAFGLDHIGGLVGQESVKRSVNPMLFVGAPRFHSGGLIGDEVPIIAKRGERVLTAEQNRAYEAGGGNVVVNQTINVQGGANSHDVVRAATAARQSAIDAMVDAQRRGRRRP